MNKARVAARLEANAGGFTVHGPLSFETASALLKQSNPILGSGEGEVRVSLAGVGRADSAGVALMLEWLRIASAAGRELTYTDVPAQLRRYIEVTNLTEAIPVHA